MADLKFSCPSCHQHIQADAGYIGLQINCPNCNHLFVVPGSPASVPATPASFGAGTNPPHLPTRAKNQSIFHRAAIAGLVALLIGVVASVVERALEQSQPASRSVVLLFAGVAGLTILLGLIFSVVALCGIPRHGTKRLLGYGLSGTIINGILLAFCIAGFLGARSKAIPDQKGSQQSMSSAATAEKPISVSTAKGWETGALRPEDNPEGFPTERLVPSDHRNAALLITLIGKGLITNLATLKQIHKVGCSQFLSSPSDKFETKELKLPNGSAYYSTFEDPDLIGKAPVPENYKFTTPVDILFDNGNVVHATIFADERAGRTFDEAMMMLRSCEVYGGNPKGPAAISGAKANGSIIISAPGLDARLTLPKFGLSGAPGLSDQGGAQFEYFRRDGLIISGWLEPISRYGGFRKLWATDKPRMEAGMGIKITNEKFEDINGWQAVSYTIVMAKDAVQTNIRACRTLGRTWADVHLSFTGEKPNVDVLKEMLKTISLVAPGSKNTTEATTASVRPGAAQQTRQP